MTAERSYQFSSAIPPAKPVAVDTPGVRTAARPRAQVYWFHPDHLGTGTLITDLEGRPHQFFLNLPYGETFIEQGGYTYDNPYKFNGKELDEETGLYYYGARYYDPKISLWLSVDPLAGHPNQVDKTPYGYAWGNPVRLTDPDGRCPDCPDETYLSLAELAYTGKIGDKTENGWEIIRVDENKNGFRGVLFKGEYKEQTHYIYAFAGTQDKKDIIEDIKQLKGQSSQYEDALKYAVELKEKYENISFTGHSLGGGLASVASLSTGNKAVTFNAAGLSIKTKRNLKIYGEKANINAYIVWGEAVDYYQSLIGLKAEGKIHYLPALYIPNVPGIQDDLIRNYQRIRNHMLESLKVRFYLYKFLNTD